MNNLYDIRQVIKKLEVNFLNFRDSSSFLGTEIHFPPTYLLNWAVKMKFF